MPLNTAPTLTGFSSSVTFLENTVNAAPQLLDADVVFADVEGNFSGGSLSLTGLLAEDRISVRNEGTGAGQIGLVGTDVTFGGVTIGTLTGGMGDALTITFNASANSTSIDALIQNLTYANIGGTPTASRDFLLNVTDAEGADLGLAAFDFTAVTVNPFAGISTGSTPKPIFADLDGDGDLDLIVGERYGSIRAFEKDNGGAGYTEFFPSTYTFQSINVGFEAAPSLIDLDGDGDLDLVAGEFSGTLRAFEFISGVGYTELTEAANPFNGIIVGDQQISQTFTDLDGDGDLDLVVGSADGTLRVYDKNNTGTGYTALTGTSNPFNGIDVGTFSAPTFADLNGDGDLDLVVGAGDGTLRYFDNNNGNAGYTELTGTANPFDGIDIGSRSTPAFVDLDGDGDLDLMVGHSNGLFSTFENLQIRGQFISVAVTPQDDATLVSGLPGAVTVLEDMASNLDLSALSIIDPDSLLTVILTASAGTMAAAGAGGVTVAGSGTGALTLTGTAAAIDAYLNNVASVQYTGTSNTNGLGAASIALTVNDGTGAVAIGTVSVNITAVNDAPTLTGLAPSVTFLENLVNATPQLLDTNVVFGDLEGGFNGGSLKLTGLLAEDQVSVRNEGAGAGQIGLSGANVSFGGVVIGTLAGGTGNALTITFNAAATPDAIDALIQNLTYTNTSNTPTASRDFALNVTDAGGESAIEVTPAFAAMADDPFNGIDIGDASAPTFTDLDGDGDLDLVVGEFYGTLRVFDHTNGAAGFTELTGAANPLDGIDIGVGSTPTFADLDDDGDLDLVVGERFGSLRVFDNNNGAAGYTELTGAANPLDGIASSFAPTPTFADLDGDGDLDLVLGEFSGTLRVFDNNNGAAGYTELTGSANPLDGINIGYLSAPTFADLDGDGDLDLVVGDSYGTLRVFDNNNGSAGYTELTGSANPFSGIDVGSGSTPTFTDLDGDGDLDLVVGSDGGSLTSFENLTVLGQVITVTVTAQDEVITGTFAGDSLTGTNRDDTISGLGGDDTLVGGIGNDELLGGAGNDTYIVDGGDRVFETTTNTSTIDAGGVDLVMTAVSYNLDATVGLRFVENLRLTGTANVNGTGNALANTLTGSAGNNIVDGKSGNDTLIGGLGNDTMLGGAGNDTYVVAQAGDQVFETTTTTSTINAGGIDLVQSAVTFSLDATVGVRFVENLTLTGTTAINGTGNALANILTGNAGNNLLNAGLGNDTMLGGAGNDTYVVNAVGDQVFETMSTTSTINAGGIDLVQSAVTFSLDAMAGVRFVENLTLTGTTAINGSGNTLANTLIGNVGNNMLNGALGNDIMTGGAGRDVFVFNTALGAANVDRITDFIVIDDTIRLDDAIFVGLAAGNLAASAFAANLTGNATDAFDRIVYETDTGRLYFDADGNGARAGIHFATLTTNLAMTNTDFFIF